MPAPYYSESGITIYHGDSREILPSLEPVDLVLTDPPYGMKANLSFGKESLKGEFKGKRGSIDHPSIIGDESTEIVGEMFKLIPAKTPKIIFGVDYFPDKVPNYFQGSILCWDKRLTESLDRQIGSCFEMIWIYPKRRKVMIRYKWAGIFGMEKEQETTRQHPTQKPLQLITKLILDYAPDAQTILDPFMGSGTTLRAAKDLGRKAIGIEIEEKYCEIAVKRLRQEVFNFGDAA